MKNVVCNDFAHIITVWQKKKKPKENFELVFRFHFNGRRKNDVSLTFPKIATESGSISDWHRLHK